ncbi:MAG TPA: hypothetical protein VK883_02270, partial [Arthrobacter sp.]|nr:hypothetical protein [Arthrobacter sp.]
DRDPNLELPPDPFPDWYLFTAAHAWPATGSDRELPVADMEDPPWPALPDPGPLDYPYPEDLPLLSA